MRLFAVGVTRRTAPVELRECLDFARAGLEHALSALTARGLAREVVVLSTCNRAEIYGVSDDDRAGAAFGRFIGDYHRVPWDRLAPQVSNVVDALVRSPSCCRGRRSGPS